MWADLHQITAETIDAAGEHRPSERDSRFGLTCSVTAALPKGCTAIVVHSAIHRRRDASSPGGDSCSLFAFAIKFGTCCTQEARFIWEIANPIQHGRVHLCGSDFDYLSDPGRWIGRDWTLFTIEKKYSGGHFNGTREDMEI